MTATRIAAIAVAAIIVVLGLIELISPFRFGHTTPPANYSYSVHMDNGDTAYRMYNGWVIQKAGS